MTTRTPLRLLLSLVLGLALFLGAGIASAAFAPRFSDDVTVVPCPEDGTEDGTTEDGVEDGVEDGTTEDGVEDCLPTGEEGDDGAEEDEGEPAPAAGEEACRTKAGLAPDDDFDLDDDGAIHGLENALQHVFDNCVKNGAPGLLNALEKLRRNFDRHAEHEAWKAEREAARDDAKAARLEVRAQRKAAQAEAKAAKQQAKGGGNPHEDKPGNGHGFGYG